MKPYPKYKPSGIEWIGDIPEIWNLINLGYISKMIVPMRDKPKDLSGNIPWLRIEDFDGKFVSESKSNQGITEDIIKEMNLKIFPVGTVLCSCSCAMGKTAIVKKPLVTNQTFIGIVPNNKVYSDFLYYLMSASEQFLNSISTGAIQAYLSREDFERLKIPLPTLSEQKNIAAFLDNKLYEIDNIILKKQKLIEALKEEKTAIINEAVTKGINPNVKMKESGIPWIGNMPEHWIIKKVKYVCSIQGRIGYKGYKSSDLVLQGEGAITLGATHISKNNIIDLTEAVYLNWDKYYESPEIMVKKGDVVFSQRGTLGCTAFIDKDYGPMTINPSLVLLKNIQINAKYLCDFLSSKYIKDIVKIISSGTAVPMISQEQLANFYILVPPLHEQIKISEFLTLKIAEISNIISKKQKLIELLQEEKTAIISEAVTGKIDVREYRINSES